MPSHNIYIYIIYREYDYGCIAPSSTTRTSYIYIQICSKHFFFFVENVLLILTNMNFFDNPYIIMKSECVE